MSSPKPRPGRSSTRAPSPRCVPSLPHRSHGRPPTAGRTGSRAEIDTRDGRGVEIAGRRPPRPVSPPPYDFRTEEDSMISQVLEAPAPEARIEQDPKALARAIVARLTYNVGKDPQTAEPHDWI